MDAPDRTDLRPQNLPEQIAYIVGHTLGLLKREEGVDQEDPEALKAWSQDAQLRGLLAVGMLRRAGTFPQQLQAEFKFQGDVSIDPDHIAGVFLESLRAEGQGAGGNVLET